MGELALVPLVASALQACKRHILGLSRHELVLDCSHGKIDETVCFGISVRLCLPGFRVCICVRPSRMSRCICRNLQAHTFCSAELGPQDWACHRHFGTFSHGSCRLAVGLCNGKLHHKGVGPFGRAVQRSFIDVQVMLEDRAFFIIFIGIGILAEGTNLGEPLYPAQHCAPIPHEDF